MLILLTESRAVMVNLSLRLSDNLIIAFNLHKIQFCGILEKSRVCVIKAVTNLMIEEYNIKKVGCDFMGYRVDRTSLLKESKHPIQFHHLIVPHRECQGLEDEGYLKWNGALLMNDSHEYLHKIEMYERKLFEYITRLMVMENEQGYLCKEQLLEIHSVLEYFERVYRHKTTKKGKNIIKKGYVMNRMTPEEIEENIYLRKSIDNISQI